MTNLESNGPTSIIEPLKDFASLANFESFNNEDHVLELKEYLPLSISEITTPIL